MSAPIPRTVDEAIDAYLKERATNPELPPISDRYETLRWFFERGKELGRHEVLRQRKDLP